MGLMLWCCCSKISDISEPDEMVTHSDLETETQSEHESESHSNLVEKLMRDQSPPSRKSMSKQMSDTSDDMSRSRGPHWTLSASTSMCRFDELIEDMDLDWKSCHE